jgi:hypothetical protein
MSKNGDSKPRGKVSHAVSFVVNVVSNVAEEERNLSAIRKASLVHANGDAMIANSKESMVQRVARVAVSATHKVLQQVGQNDAITAYAYKPVGRPFFCNIINYNNCSCIGWCKTDGIGEPDNCSNGSDECT